MTLKDQRERIHFRSLSVIDQQTGGQYCYTDMDQYGERDDRYTDTDRYGQRYEEMHHNRAGDYQHTTHMDRDRDSRYTHTDQDREQSYLYNDIHVDQYEQRAYHPNVPPPSYDEVQFNNPSFSG